MTKKIAVIAGASGLIGRRIADQLMTDGGWNVIGLARRGQTRSGMQWLAVDLAADRIGQSRRRALLRAIA